MTIAPPPRHILMTVDAVGGVWRYAMDLGSALSQRGTHVTFVCLGPVPTPMQRREAEAIGELVEIDAPLDWMVSSPDELAGVPDRLADLAVKHGVDLVHLNVPSQAAGLGVDLPVVTVAHSCVVTWFRAVRGTGVPPGWEWQLELNRSGFDAADVVLAPSKSFADLLTASHGELAQLRTVYNAARPIRSAPVKEPFILAAGRWWDDGKNGATLDAASRLSQWPVRMAGAVAGPNGQHFHVEAAQHLGELPNAALRDLASRAAIFCSPSIYEPFGLAPLEAASAGAALVLSDIPTYRELWEGAALFAAPTDAAGFAARLNQLASMPDLRRQLGQEATRRAAQFSLAAQADGVLCAYTDAAAFHATKLRLRA